MGCGCGKGKRKVNVKLQSAKNDVRRGGITLSCPKCGHGSMLLRQQYSPKHRKYVKMWTCGKCGHKVYGSR